MANKEWFVYSFVARGMTILAEYTTSSNNLLSIDAVKWLPNLNLPVRFQKKFSSNHDQHNFSFLVEGEYVYAVVAKESVGKQISFELLERIKIDFERRYSRGQRDAATPKSLSKEFGAIMKEHIIYVIEHFEEIDKVGKLKTQIADIQVILWDNINKVVERGQHIDAVAANAKQLRDESLMYKKTATEVKRKMWLENMKIKLIILGVLVILGLIIWVSVCHGFNCA